MGDNPPATISNELVDVESFRELVQQLKRAVEQRDYGMTIHHTTTAIDQILEPQLLTFLDIRAYNHALQGRIQLALKDAQRMIGHAPGEAMGYLRKAETLSMYGRQICAIEAYDEGINSVARNHKEMARLVNGRSNAVLVNKKTVDLFACFPTEITNNITSRLPQATITECLMTSKTWRQQVLKSRAEVWRNLSIDEEHGSNLISAAPLIGRFVEHLTINTPSKSIRDACFRAIRNGHLGEIRSLKVTAVASNSLRQSIVTMSNALWQARNTLKQIDIDLGKHEQTITLADILLSCNTVTDIVFSCKSSMAPLSGDYSTVEGHHSLTNLQLTADSIERAHIEGILQRCRRLQRLVMHGCCQTVLEPISKYASNLEILGYNCTDVPDWTYEDPQPGLKILYTNDGGAEVPIGDLLPLIYKNMKALQDLRAVVSSPTEPEFQEFLRAYRDLKLEKVKRLTVWPHVRVQPLIMRAIRGVRTLEDLYVVEPFEADPLFKAAMRLPILTTLGITHAQTNGNISGRFTLIQLLGGYAHFSTTGKSLRSAQFRYGDLIDDSVLAALADIKTLEDVTLRCLNNVTTAGVNLLLEKTRNQLKTLALAEMVSVSDTTLITLSGSKTLTSIDLDSLPNLTQEKIKDLLFDNTSPMLATVKLDGDVLYTRS